MNQSRLDPTHLSESLRFQTQLEPIFNKDLKKIDL